MKFIDGSIGHILFLVLVTKVCRNSREGVKIGVKISDKSRSEVKNRTENGWLEFPVYSNPRKNIRDGSEGQTQRTRLDLELVLEESTIKGHSIGYPCV